MRRLGCQRELTWQSRVAWRQGGTWVLPDARSGSSGAFSRLCGLGTGWFRGIGDDVDAGVVGPAGEADFALAFEDVDEAAADEVLTPAGEELGKLAGLAGVIIHEFPQSLGAAEEIAAEAFLMADGLGDDGEEVDGGLDHG